MAIVARADVQSVSLILCLGQCVYLLPYDEFCDAPLFARRDDLKWIAKHDGIYSGPAVCNATRIGGLYGFLLIHGTALQFYIPGSVLNCYVSQYGSLQKGDPIQADIYDKVVF